MRWRHKLYAKIFGYFWKKEKFPEWYSSMCSNALKKLEDNMIMGTPKQDTKK